MRRVHNFYAKIGDGFEWLFLKARLPRLILKPEDYKVFEMRQTVGRHTYYDLLNTLSLPHHIRWEVRMPSKLAMSEDSRKNNPIVEKEILNFLNSKLKHNILNPEKALDLDITINEAISIS